MGKGRAKAVVVGEWKKDMGKTQTMEESIRGRGKENVRVAKKERKKVMAEEEGGVEEGGVEGEAGVGEGVGGSKTHGRGERKHKLSS